MLFGGGNDTLTIGAVGSGPLINSVFDGGAGDNTVVFAELMPFDDVTSARFGADLVSLALDDGSGGISGDFRDFGLWQFGEEAPLSTAEFRAALPRATVVPVPAALPLLLSALGGLALLRRRGTRA